MQQIEAQALVERLPFGAGVQVYVSQVEFPGFLDQRLHDLARQTLVTKFRPGEDVDDPSVCALRRSGLPHNVHHLQKSSCCKRLAIQSDTGEKIAFKVFGEKSHELVMCF